MARQVSEGVEIEMYRGELLNSKSEWNKVRIPQIVIEEGERHIEDETSGLGEEEESYCKKRGKNLQRNVPHLKFSLVFSVKV